MTASTPLTPEVVSQDGNAMVLSMGPQHPSTHGVLQIMLEIEGENIVKAEPEIGYLHTGIEKNCRKPVLVAGADRRRAHGLSRAAHPTRCATRWRSRSCSASPTTFPSARSSIRVLHRGAHAHRVALRVAGHARHRPRRDLGVFLLLRPAREHSRSARGRRRRAHASELHARRRRERRSCPTGYLRTARRADREVPGAHARPARAAAGQSDLAGPHDRRRHHHARRSGRSGA